MRLVLTEEDDSEAVKKLLFEPAATHAPAARPRPIHPPAPLPQP